MASGSLEATAPSDDTSAADELVRQAREEERRLVQSAIVHDAAAFAALYDLHVVRVYRHIYYLVHDVKQTEDLTAQTFLKAWEAVARYKERGAPFIAWLLRIAHNLTVSYLRAKKDPARLRTLSLLLFGLTILSAGNLQGAKGIIALVASGGLGLLMPKIWLSSRVRGRQKIILKSLPDAFDLVTTCVEAGLGLDAALARVAEKEEGPFGEELTITLREISLG